MSRQGLRPLAVALSLLLLTALPTQANPVRFADVIAQAVTNDTGGRQTFDLRLRTLPQDARLSTSGAQTPTSNNPGNNDQTQTPATTGGNGSVTNTEVQTPTPGQSDNVETVQVGDVTGTVCDCGDIIVPGGHFPKLPFLALAGIPFLFIHHEDTPPPGSTPTPTPPPQTPVPEPTTLLLLGSGLVAIGAGARRRRARAAVRALDLPSAGEV